MALEAFPAVATVILGANFRVAQFVAWNGTDTGEVAPSSLEIRPVRVRGLQFVGLNVKCSRLNEHVDLLDLDGDAVDQVRDRVGAACVCSDGEVRGGGVYFDFGAYDKTVAWGLLARVGCVVLEVERPGLDGVHDRQPEGGACVFFGDVDASAGDGDGVRADACADGRFADLAFRAAGPFVGLRFGAQLDGGE